MSKIIVVAECKGCGSVVVDDGISYKCVPSREWLHTHGHVFKEAKDKMAFFVCDRCVNNYATDLCDCGSGEKVGECACGSEAPVVTIGEPLPNYM